MGNATIEHEIRLLTLVMSPSSTTALLIFLNSSYNASTSLTVTALMVKQVTSVQTLTRSLVIENGKMIV